MRGESVENRQIDKRFVTSSSIVDDAKGVSERTDKRPARQSGSDRTETYTRRSGKGRRRNDKSNRSGVSRSKMACEGRGFEADDGGRREEKVWSGGREGTARTVKEFSIVGVPIGVVAG